MKTVAISLLSLTLIAGTTLPTKRAEASPIRLPQNKNIAGADDGSEEIQAEGMVLRSLQTRTGIKFVIT